MVRFQVLDENGNETGEQNLPAGVRMLMNRQRAKEGSDVSPRDVALNQNSLLNRKPLARNSFFQPSQILDPTPPVPVPQRADGLSDVGFDAGLAFGSLVNRNAPGIMRQRLQMEGPQREAEGERLKNIGSLFDENAGTYSDMSPMESVIESRLLREAEESRDINWFGETEEYEMPKRISMSRQQREFADELDNLAPAFEEIQDIYEWLETEVGFNDDNQLNRPGAWMDSQIDYQRKLVDAGINPPESLTEMLVARNVAEVEAQEKLDRLNNGLQGVVKQFGSFESMAQEVTGNPNLNLFDLDIKDLYQIGLETIAAAEEDRQEETSEIEMAVEAQSNKESRIRQGLYLPQIKTPDGLSESFVNFSNRGLLAETGGEFVINFDAVNTREDAIQSFVINANLDPSGMFGPFNPALVDDDDTLLGYPSDSPTFIKDLGDTPNFYAKFAGHLAAISDETGFGLDFFNTLPQNEQISIAKEVYSAIVSSVDPKLGFNQNENLRIIRRQLGLSGIDDSIERELAENLAAEQLSLLEVVDDAPETDGEG